MKVKITDILIWILVLALIALGIYVLIRPK